jgi:benzoate-CoA ligase family protein
MADAQQTSRFRVPGRPLNLTDRFLDRQVREGRADHPAVIVDQPDGVETYTYAEVAGRANRFGHALRAAGLGIEDRVLIVLPDGIEWVAAFFGALKIGCVTLFVNPKLSAEELAFYIADSRASGVVVDGEGADKLAGDAPVTRFNIDGPAFRSTFDQLPAQLEPAPTLEEDFAIWLYSSGSTGAPKAAVHRAYDFVFNTERYAQHVLGLTERDVTLSVPKLFFGYATGANLLFPLYFGGTAVLFPDRPTPERLFELIERHRPTVLINVPTMIAQMAAHYEATPCDTGSLRLLTSAGEALPPDLVRRWMAGPGVEILDGIGSAEMFHVFISARAGEVVPGSLGTLVEGYEARIVGPDGQDCGPGEVGTLWVAGDSAAAFYWQRMEKSREVLRGRWVVTGDLFLRREDGHFFYQGRADDMMKVGGRWVSPQEIEDALTRHDAVAEAGASRVERDGLTKPVAFVTLREGHEASDDLAQALQQHVATTLAPYKAPREIHFVDRLPRGDRDKLDRKTLLAWAGERADG